jgi:uncharacterized Fe-S cluster-containing protein
VDDLPKTHSEAYASLDAQYWKDELGKSVIDQLGANRLVVNGYLKKKLKLDGTIDKYKARLVVKRFI